MTDARDPREPDGDRVPDELASSPYGPAATPAPPGETGERVTPYGPAAPATPAAPHGVSSPGGPITPYGPAAPEEQAPLHGTPASPADPDPASAPPVGPTDPAATSPADPEPPAAPIDPAVASSPTPRASRPGALGGRGLAVAAMATGIVAMACALGRAQGAVVLGLGLAAGILGIRALRRTAASRGMAVAGLATAGTALVLGVLAPFLVMSVVLRTPGPGDGPSADGSSHSRDDASGKADDAGGRAGSGDPRGSEPEDPAPLMTTVTGEGDDGPEWRVTIGTPTFHMTEAVLDAIAVNPPPDPGMDYAVLPLAVTREAADRGDPLDEIAVDYVAEDGTGSIPERYVTAPGADVHVGSLAQGESASIVLVIQVPQGDSGGGTWSVTPGLTSDTSWFVAEP
jgi:hypothetical protein